MRSTCLVLLSTLAVSPLAVVSWIGNPAHAGDFNLSGRVQGRLTHEAPDTTYFTLQRTRLKAKGNAQDDTVSWQFELDFGKDKFTLKDFYLDRHFSGATLRVGQWKKPFSRQRLTSSGSLQFVDRTANMKAFNADRDVGIGLHNNIKKSPRFEWALNVFNGLGPNTVAEQMSPMVVARVGYNHNGLKGYSETDFEGGALRFGVAASVMSDLHLAESALEPEHIAQADFSLKAHGFSSVGAVFMNLTDSAVGAHLQAGYLMSGKWEPAVRAVYIDSADGLHQELGFAFSTYFNQHKFKWQSDLSTLFGNEEGVDWVARSQLQLAF
jgi:hypothetical protein